MRLSFSYRLPPPLIPALNDFRTTFLKESGATPLQAGSDYQVGQLAFGCRLRWRQVPAARFDEELAEVALAAPADMGLPPADVVAMVQYGSTGLALVRRLQAAGHKVKHVFGETQESRRSHRKAFWKGQAYLASTIHSFKGYEQRGVVLGIGPAMDDEDIDSLVAAYIGLTRVKAMPDGSASLTVVCADDRLEAFGSRWFDVE